LFSESLLCDHVAIVMLFDFDFSSDYEISS